MYVIKKMKLNSFKNRPIVSNRELFISKGESPATIQSKDSVDCYDNPTIDGASKLKTLGLAEEIAKTAVEKHESAGKSENLKIKNAKDY